MKFVVFASGGTDAIGVRMSDGALRGLAASSPVYPGDLDTLIRAGRVALEQAGKLLSAAPVIDEAVIEFLPPFRRPEKVLCAGLNYLDHSNETGHPPVSYPAIFARFPTSLIGHGQPIALPPMSHELDFEGELAAIIGIGGHRISRQDALRHVAGYAVFNDTTLRDYQMKSSSKQWTMGKNFDRTGAFGPSFVTEDELPPGATGLHLETRLNGEVMQSATTADMIFDVAALVEIISEVMTLSAGDVIVTGTPGGVGMFRKPMLWMKPGDVCEVEIDGVGLLQNVIVAEKKGAVAA